MNAMRMVILPNASFKHPFFCFFLLSSTKYSIENLLSGVSMSTKLCVCMQNVVSVIYFLQFFFYKIPFFPHQILFFFIVFLSYIVQNKSLKYYFLSLSELKGARKTTLTFRVATAKLKTRKRVFSKKCRLKKINLVANVVKIMSVLTRCKIIF